MQVKEDIAYIAGPVRHQVWDGWPTDNESVTDVFIFAFENYCAVIAVPNVCASSE